MNTITKYVLVLVVFTFAELSIAQNNLPALPKTLSFEAYLGLVKEHHPLLKQANLRLSIGEANLLKSRGGFDPKFEIDYGRKKFKDLEYFDQFNATFKIPTWYGIEFKANFEENTGAFLNPNLTVPENGLYSAGVSFSLAQGFLMNERMAMVKKARFFMEQTKAERELLVNNVIFEASNAYFEWLEASNELDMYNRFLSNAEKRYKAVKRNVEVGEKAAIDLVEAKITVKNRKLNREAARLKTRKAILNASNYLWLNDVPLEIEAAVSPIQPDSEMLRSSLYLEGISQGTDLVAIHPKLKRLEAKINGLKIDRSLKRNKLLPKLDLQYNFLAPQVNRLNNFNTANYKAMVNFSFPLFLRKERGDLKLVKLKLQEVNFERISASLSLQNKIDAAVAEINSLTIQNTLIKEVVSDYQTMLTAEERMFELGESSLFLINSREQLLIEASLKANRVEIKSLKASAKLYNAAGISSINN